ncbi:hypothetical protein, partial [Photobacterium galatheae]|uniref:hypothetical protein n=1 Tax=Photobacterium galatheae TaxID=1654360 RepID=UPI001F3B890C
SNFRLNFFIDLDEKYRQIIMSTTISLLEYTEADQAQQRQQVLEFILNNLPGFNQSRCSSSGRFCH